MKISEIKNRKLMELTPNEISTLLEDFNILRTLEFIYHEIPESMNSIDKQIKITPNEICTLLEKFLAINVEKNKKS